MNFHPFRAANGDLITNLGLPPTADNSPKPPKAPEPEVFDLQTCAGRVLKGAREIGYPNPFKTFVQACYEMSLEVDELREQVAKLQKAGI